MGTSSIDRIDPVELGIQTTVMAIREEIMGYFKGTCIQKFTAEQNVRVRTINIRADYQYERRQWENERPSIVWLGSVPILTVKHSPDRVIFHDTVLSRSPQLRQVKVGVEQFMEKFLRGVEKEYNGADRI